jgi:mono/diheme cytochrome c family protein
MCETPVERRIRRLRWLFLAVLGACGLVLGVVIAYRSSLPPPPPPPLVSEAQLRVRAHDPQLISRGHALWGNCVGCHGLEGQGVQGPDLTDDYWLHGSDMRDLCRSIAEGYPLKGMPSWRVFAGLGDDDVQALAAYVVSLRGSAHAPGRAHEGVLAPITY